MEEKIPEEPEFDACEFYGPLIFCNHALPVFIEDQIACTERTTRLVFAPADQGIHPRQEFSCVEWFGKVIISAGLEALHLLKPCIPCCENDYRRLIPL